MAEDIGSRLFLPIVAKWLAYGIDDDETFYNIATGFNF